jgi:hypothetical protein
MILGDSEYPLCLANIPAGAKIVPRVTGVLRQDSIRP